MNLRDIQPGWACYGSDGQKIGDVSTVGSNYVHITKGLLFKSDIFIPDSAITRVEDGAFYISTPKDRIEDMHWDTPPVTGAYTGAPGEQYTTGQTTGFENVGRPMESSEFDRTTESGRYGTGSMGGTSRFDMNDIRPGCDVFSADNDKVCTVSDVSTDYFHCSAGLLQTKDLYIPLDAVSSVDQNAVHLNVNKDQIDSMHWDETRGQAGFREGGGISIPPSEQELRAPED